MDDEALVRMGARDLRDCIADGRLSAADLASACLKRIEAVEPRVQAWTFLDGDLAMRQAKALDALRDAGGAGGPLHGLPVGVKDIIDTHDMPTQNGTAVDTGRQPGADATLVARLRAAGALVLGKTVTTELATFRPGKTRNPHDPERTPGGSSSGSAAAVAAGMVPLAIGTQTYGSVIRPASFCGSIGFKPTHGLIPRTGVCLLAAPLDTIGVFARNVADAALIAEALIGPDAADPDARRAAAAPGLLDICLSEPPTAPALAFVRTPMWDEAEPDTQEGFARLVTALGKQCTAVTLPKMFGEWQAAHRALMLAGMARNLEPYYRKAKDRLSDMLRGMIEAGQTVPATDTLAALDLREALNACLNELLERYDAIITPAAPGEAPRGLDTTGNPVFNGLWTLCGMPAVSLPLMRGANGLPIGVQVVGRRGDDARLLRSARWLVHALRDRDEDASVAGRDA